MFFKIIYERILILNASKHWSFFLRNHSNQERAQYGYAKAFYLFHTFVNFINLFQNFLRFIVGVAEKHSIKSYAAALLPQNDLKFRIYLGMKLFAAFMYFYDGKKTFGNFGLQFVSFLNIRIQIMYYGTIWISKS